MPFFRPDSKVQNTEPFQNRARDERSYATFAFPAECTRRAKIYGNNWLLNVHYWLSNFWELRAVLAKNLDMIFIFISLFWLRQVNLLELEPRNEHYRDTLFWHMFGFTLLFKNFADAVSYRRELIRNNQPTPPMYSEDGQQILADAILDPNAVNSSRLDYEFGMQDPRNSTLFNHITDGKLLFYVDFLLLLLLLFLFFFFFFFFFHATHFRSHNNSLNSLFISAFFYSIKVSSLRAKCLK